MRRFLYLVALLTMAVFIGACSNGIANSTSGVTGPDNWVIVSDLQSQYPTTDNEHYTAAVKSTVVGALADVNVNAQSEPRGFQAQAEWSSLDSQISVCVYPNSSLSKLVGGCVLVDQKDYLADAPAHKGSLLLPKAQAKLAEMFKRQLGSAQPEASPKATASASDKDKK